MSWIKMREELQTHPKIVRILSATQSDKFRVVGGLHAVWCIFDKHSEDGVLVGYTPKTLDHIVGWDGLSDALISVEWLVFDGVQTLSLPEFDEHNSQSAKRRAEDQKRKEKARKSPQSVRNLSADEADNEQKKLGPEKEKEKEKELTTHTPGVPAQISIVMRKYSISANPSHPTVIALAEQGVDLETLEACCKETREAKPNETVSISYIAKKLEGWKAQAAQVNVSGATKKKADTWFLSVQSMSAKARELGIPDARMGESEAAFKARIQMAINGRSAA
jgi:hypothetical protein